MFTVLSFPWPLFVLSVPVKYRAPNRSHGQSSRHGVEGPAAASAASPSSSPSSPWALLPDIEASLSWKEAAACCFSEPDSSFQLHQGEATQIDTHTTKRTPLAGQLGGENRIHSDKYCRTYEMKTRENSSVRRRVR